MERHTLAFFRILLAIYLVCNLLLPSSGLATAVVDAPAGHAVDNNKGGGHRRPRLALSKKGVSPTNHDSLSANPPRHQDQEDSLKKRASSNTERPPSARPRRNSRIPDPGLLLLNLLEDVPETALLADVLDTMAMRTAPELLVRRAKPQELADTLTISVYSTMLIVGSFVFGLGSLVLTWKVFHSIREASKTEPVSFRFFLTLAGIRYLYNHIRYHLWDMPLQPRRRFASFIGHRGSKADLFDLSSENWTDSHSHTSRPSRRESMLRHDNIPHSAMSSSAANALATQKQRRKSMVKKKGMANLEMLDNVPDRRHSIAAVQTPPSSARSSEKSSPVPDATCPSAARSRIPSVIFEEPTVDPNTGKEDLRIEQPAILEDPIMVVSPIPQSPALLTKLNEVAVPDYRRLELSDHSEEYSQGSETSEHTDERRPSTDYTLSTGESGFTETPAVPDESFGRSSVLSHTDDYEMRSWTPISHEEHLHSTAAVSREELNQKRFDWVKTMSLFDNEHPLLPLEITERPIKRTIAVPESKLSKRLVAAAASRDTSNAGLANGLAQSKLSRYFTLPTVPPPASSSTDIAATLPSRLSPTGGTLDPIAQKLHEGDLTPPPGFSRRHSSFSPAPGALNAYRGASSTVRGPRFTDVADAGQRPDRPFEQTGRRSSDDDDGEDTVSPPSAYHQAFMNSAFRRRSTLDSGPEAASPSSNPTSWRWVLDREDSSAPLHGIGEDGFGGPCSGPWNSSPHNPPLRPHSAGLPRNFQKPRDENASRSTGRLTPDDEFLEGAFHSHAKIPSHPRPPLSNLPDHRPNLCLGIFDDIFPNPDRSRDTRFR